MLEIITGAGSAGDDHWSLGRAVLEEIVTGHWSGQCWRSSLERAVLEMVTGAGSAGYGHWSLERAVLEMVTGH